MAYRPPKKGLTSLFVDLLKELELGKNDDLDW